ncbi:MAG: glycoside hydrolase family 32 protein [Verrucomicrobia bacterium]|nr:glycoside hydrolase family 32 protein [Verrucomicrobiota bacterium]
MKTFLPLLCVAVAVPLAPFAARAADDIVLAGPKETAAGAPLSPEFKIERKFINFLIRGPRDLPATLGVELLAEDRVVRAASATEMLDPTRTLHWRTWDVGELAARTARIRVNSKSATGAIAVEQFAQSDQPKGVPSDASTLLHETHRPQFHFTAQTGWLNDANGMVHYKGQWHLFHQHRPPGCPSIVWGHAVSDDLLHWRHLPTAIPCEGKNGIASGSGHVDWENASGLKHGDDPPILLVYTLMPPTGSGLKATQCLAFSTDGGRTFEQFAGNPLLRTTDSKDRDPKVFFHKPARAWFMALSLSRNNTDREHATYGLFRSRDLKSWELLQEIGPGAWYWECPDMFELPVDGDRSRMKWLLTKGSGDYIVGEFDGERFKPQTGPIRTQWGGSFYGAQTFSDAPGARRVQIAWMNSGDKAEKPNAYPGMPFNQQMSFPRELTLRTTPEGPRVFRQPIAEITKLYEKTHESGPRPLEPGDNALAGIHHDLLDIELELEPGQTKQVKLTLRGEELIYDVKNGKLRIGDRSLALAPLDGKLILRALLDRTSIELFGNRGEVTHSRVFFADPANRNVALTVQGGAAQVQRLVVRELRSIWATP